MQMHGKKKYMRGLDIFENSLVLMKNYLLIFRAQILKMTRDFKNDWRTQ